MEWPVSSGMDVRACEHADARGRLFVVGVDDLPFVPRRVFWIRDVPSGAVRGGHAHRTTSEVLFALNGSVEVSIDAGDGERRVVLDDPAVGLYIGAGVWCDLRRFSVDAVCMVLASEDFRPEGYINDHAQFLSERVSQPRPEGLSPEWSIVPYNPSLREEWDAVVRRSCNGTFLFERDFMDYHADRFRDCSLLLRRSGRSVALFAACLEGNTVVAHAGLTYGGLLLADAVRGARAVSLMSAVCTYYREHLCARRLVVKPVPWIYHERPCEEPLYALFRVGARLEARAISSYVVSGSVPWSQLRRRQLRRAEGAEVRVREWSCGEGVDALWPVLETCLKERHGVRPVHTSCEMRLLIERFPERIRLFVAEGTDGALLAGTIVFVCGHVWHTQYLCTSDEGRRVGALDAVVSRLCEQAAALDFGVSTEHGGSILNEGLLRQKEGFGGRGVCYDTYVVDL